MTEEQKINKRGKTRNLRKGESDSFLGEFSSPVAKYALYGVVGLAIIFLVVQLISFTGLTKTSSTNSAANTINGVSKNAQIDLNEISAEVLPKNGFTIEAKWGDSISKMVKAGVLDEDKLNNILTNRYRQPLTAEQKKLFNSEYSDEKLTIDGNNGVFMMYVLWTLGKHNDNPIPKASPFAKYFDNYDIGVGKAGYADTKLIELTPEQQEIAERVALNSYRPCCGNPTGNPDCSHGFAALGLVELMASQGFSEEEIFDAFVKFNSFWFPSTYIQNAMYFKLAENKNWEDVDRGLVAGKQYSSAGGAYSVKKYLEGLGI